MGELHAATFIVMMSLIFGVLCGCQYLLGQINNNLIAIRQVFDMLKKHHESK